MAEIYLVFVVICLHGWKKVWSFVNLWIACDPWSMVLKDRLWMFLHSHHHRETFDLEISAIHISKPNVSPWWQIEVYRQTNPKIRHHGITKFERYPATGGPKSFAGKDYCVYGPGERFKNHMLCAIKGFMVGQKNCKPLWYMWHCSNRCGDKMASYGTENHVTWFLFLPRRKNQRTGRWTHFLWNKKQYRLLAYFGEYYPCFPTHVFVSRSSLTCILVLWLGNLCLLLWNLRWL